MHYGRAHCSRPARCWGTNRCVAAFRAGCPASAGGTRVALAFSQHRDEESTKRSDEISALRDDDRKSEFPSSWYRPPRRSRERNGERKRH
jgi:hypothetical protein